MSTLPPKPPTPYPSLYAVHVKVFSAHPNSRGREPIYISHPEISKITFLHPTLLLANCHARQVALFGNDRNNFLPTTEQIREGEEATANPRSDREYISNVQIHERETSRSRGTSRDGRVEEARELITEEERVSFYKVGWDKDGCIFLDVEFEVLKEITDRYSSQTGLSPARHYRREPLRKVLVYVRRLTVDDGRTKMAPAVKRNLYRCMPVDWVGEPIGNKLQREAGDPDVLARLFNRGENVKTAIIKSEPNGGDTPFGNSSKTAFTTITRGTQTFRSIHIAPVLPQKREYCTVGVQTSPSPVAPARQFSSAAVQANWTPAAPIRQCSSVGVQVNVLRYSKKPDSTEFETPHAAATLASGAGTLKTPAITKSIGIMTDPVEFSPTNPSANINKPENTQPGKRKFLQHKSTDQDQNQSAITTEASSTKHKQLSTNPTRNDHGSTSAQIVVTSQTAASYPPAKSSSVTIKKSVNPASQEQPFKRQKLEFTTTPIQLEPANSNITEQQIDNSKITSILSSQLHELNKYLFNLHPILTESSAILRSQEENIAAKEAHILHRENMLKQKEVQVIAGKEWLEIGKSDLKIEREKFEREVRKWKEERGE